MDGVALILCEGFFGTGDGKTANGLVRHTERYQIAGVLDSRLAGRDAGEVLGGDPCQAPSEGSSLKMSREEFFQREFGSSMEVRPEFFQFQPPLRGWKNSGLEKWKRATASGAASRVNSR